MATPAPGPSVPRQPKSESVNNSSSQSTQRPTRARPRPTYNAARDNVTIHPSAIVATKAEVIGSKQITVHAQAIVHPFATLDSELRPIVIGEGCIIWDGAKIGEFHMPRPPKAPEMRDTTLGKNVVVEAQAVIEAGTLVGDGVVIEAGSRVGMNCTIGAYARLAPRTFLPENSMLPEFTVLFHDPVTGQQMQRSNRTLRDNAQIRSSYANGHQQLLNALQTILMSNGSGRWP